MCRMPYCPSDEIYYEFDDSDYDDDDDDDESPFFGFLADLFLLFFLLQYGWNFRSFFI